MYDDLIDKKPIFILDDNIRDNVDNIVDHIDVLDVDD